MRKKIFSPIFLLLFVFMSFFPFESARGSAGWMLLSGSGATKLLNMTPGKLFDSMLEETGADKNEVKNSVATFNQSRQKKQAPTVYLSFSPPNPSDGTEITATAMPAYFLNNSPNDLYYTWYLQRAQCVPSGEKFDQQEIDPTSVPAICNPDSDDVIDVNDYKIAAARIIANGGFDWGRTNPSPYDSETDSDGYEAPFGGNDQEGKNAYCYVHDWKSGNEYILPECEHLFPHGGNIPGDVGDGEFGLAEEEYWHTDPHNNDTAGMTFNDESSVAGRGMAKFTWNYQAGDRVGVAVEGISMEPTQMDDSSYKTMWALPKNTCNVGDFLGEWDYGDYVTDERPLGEPFDLTDEEAAAWFADEEHVIPWLEENDITLQEEPETATACINKTAGVLGAPTADTTITIDDCAGGVPDPVVWANTTYIRVGVTGSDEIMGTPSGFIYPTTTVSRDPETAPSHANDAPIVGNTITETYVVARRVTQNDINLTLTIEDMLTITKTLTDVNGAEVSPPETTVVGPLSYSVTGNAFTMTVDDLNDCLVKNLVTPADVTEGGNKMEVSLTAIPENPMNDPTGENSDTVVVTSSVQNVMNEDFLRYDWEVYAGNSDSIVSDNWGAPLLKDDLVDSTQTSGIGIKDFTFKLQLQIPDGDFPTEDVHYLKVRLTAKETDQANGGTAREGRASVVIQLSSSSERIQAYNGSTTDASTLALGNAICEKGGASDLESAKADQNYNICPVVKNQIIGLQYSGDDAADHDFLWTVNGEPLTYSACFFAGCSETKQTNVAFFPVLKDVGATYTVAMSAVNSAGNKITLTRTFAVVEPSIKIVATGGAEPTLLGAYVDLDGGSWDDLSEIDFQAVPGTTADFTFEVYPRTVPPEYVDPVGTKTIWHVDGIDSTNPADSGSVSIAANKLRGEYYMVALDTLYTPTNDIKKILNANWEVGYDQFYEKQLSGAVNIEMVDALPGTTADNSQAGPPKKILATMISGLPSYINFLFRIVLTTFLLLFGIWIVLSLFPAPITNENEPR